VLLLLLLLLLQLTNRRYSDEFDILKTKSNGYISVTDRAVHYFYNENHRLPISHGN
jgi:hypothetical protein